jgi:hypothetical protein
LCSTKYEQHVNDESFVVRQMERASWGLISPV